MWDFYVFNGCYFMMFIIKMGNLWVVLGELCVEWGGIGVELVF